MNVYRGTTSLTGTSGGATVTLAAPVPVGKSFVIATLRSQVARPDSSLPQIWLDTNVSGNWTELKFSRARGATNEDVVISWEVVTGDDFIVQQGSSTIGSGSATQTATISSITTSRAFPIIFWNPSNANDNARNSALDVAITNATTLTFNRVVTTANTVGVRWQVVEWVDATVASYPANLTGFSVNTTITSVNTANTFVLPYYTVTNTLLTGGENSPRVRITSSTNITASRSNNNNNINLRYFVVSHPKIAVKSGAGTIANGSGAGTATISTAAEDKTFLAAHVLGNGQGNQPQRTRNHHVLTNSTTLTFTRTDPIGDITVSYQAVDLTTQNAAGTGILHLVEPIFFPNAVEAGATGTSVFILGEPAFFANEPRVRDRIWENANKPTTTWT